MPYIFRSDDDLPENTNTSAFEEAINDFIRKIEDDYPLTTLYGPLPAHLDLEYHIAQSHRIFHDHQIKLTFFVEKYNADTHESDHVGLMWLKFDLDGSTGSIHSSLYFRNTTNNVLTVEGGANGNVSSVVQSAVAAIVAEIEEVFRVHLANGGRRRGRRGKRTKRTMKRIRGRSSRKISNKSRA